AEPIRDVAPQPVASPATPITLPVFAADAAPTPTEALLPTEALTSIEALPASEPEALTSPEPEALPTWAAQPPMDTALDAGFVDLDARLGPAPAPARNGNGRHASEAE